MRRWQAVILAVVFLAGGIVIGTKIKSSSTSTNQYSTSIQISPTEIPVSLIPTTIPSPTILSQSNTVTPVTVGSGSQSDIVEVSPLTANMTSAPTGTDVTFSVTLENISNNQKLIKKVCFSSDEGNFGCTQGMNIGSQQLFSLNNSTRFVHPGVKSVWVTWSQDDVNYYMPVNAVTAHVVIQ